MRILMLTHRLPFPPTTGDKVRAYHVARHLAGRHDLTLAFLMDEPGSATALSDLTAKIPDLVHASANGSRRGRLLSALSLLRGVSATMTYFDSATFRSEIRQRVARERFDLVYVHSSSMAQYLDILPPDVPVVMDFVDVDSEKWQEYGRTMPPPLRWAYQAEARQLQTHERKAAARASRSLVVTDEERAVLERTTGWTTTTVVPNGVDLEYFAPPASPSDRPVVVFTGAMNYPPNVEGACWFAERVLPRVRAVVPAASFVIAGKEPVRRVRRLAALPGVVVTGTVPDIRPYLHEAAVAVSPLRIARGVQNKILEAMATALPVVATPAAHRGLLARPSRDLLVAETSEQLAEAVTALLQAPAQRRAIGDAGRRFVETHHAWPACLAMIDAVLTQALATRITPPMVAERA